jgi:exosortase
VIRSPAWLLAVGVVLAALGFTYFPAIRTMVQVWVDKPEYSHGFLVPLFAAYLLWLRRDHAPEQIAWPNPAGLLFLVAGAGLFLVAERTNFAKEWVQGFSLIVCLAGVAWLFGGRQAAVWAAPALGFLVFMLPLPYKVEVALGWYLQNVAVKASTFILQLLGYPAYGEGHVISVGETVLGVEKACNGLSMLLTFIALAMAALVRRPWLDKALILLSAVPIAVAANVVRIVVTGVVYVEGYKKLGDVIFHDLAGWLMMPLALVFIWTLLKAIDWLLVVPDDIPRDEILMRTVRQPVEVATIEAQAKVRPDVTAAIKPREDLLRAVVNAPPAPAPKRKPGSKK